MPLVEPELVAPAEAGLPTRPETREEETHKVEVEMNVEARKEVSVIEGQGRLLHSCLSVVTTLPLL